MRSQDYPEWLIILILGFWPELESMKEQVTKGLSLDPVSFDADRKYWEQEGNTLQKRGPRQSRIPRNTNSRVENVAIMMADIQTAINARCTPEEAFSVRTYCMLWTEDRTQELSNVLTEIALNTLKKLVVDLNCG